MVSILQADATSRLTFKELCPPAQRSRVEAAKMFGKILGKSTKVACNQQLFLVVIMYIVIIGLHQRGAIYLSQKPSDRPHYGEIEIELKNTSIEHLR